MYYVRLYSYCDGSREFHMILPDLAEIYLLYSTLLR